MTVARLLREGELHQASRLGGRRGSKVWGELTPSR